MAADTGPQPPPSPARAGALVVYRGPLERSRLAFLLRSAAAAYGELEFVWLVPRPLHWQDPAPRTALEDFLAAFPAVSRSVLMDGRLHAIPAAMRGLRRFDGGSGRPVVSVGFNSLLYTRSLAAGPLVWCPNGVPEERLLHRASLVDRAWVDAEWWVMGAGRAPDLVVPVSEQMALHLERRFSRSLNCFVAPSCVDVETFAPRRRVDRRYLTYLGTGAPWQGLDLLAEVWTALARTDPDVRFRVISRDPRTRRLARDLPEGAVEFTPASGPDEVAPLLWEARAGFVIRSPHVVNQVSYPTKFGEYVAAGTPVVATDLGWDLSAVIKDTGCGVLVPPGGDVSAIAGDVDGFLRGGEPATACRHAAARLDGRRWVESLARALP